MIKPILFKTDGSQEHVVPKNNKLFSLKELQEFVHGYIEVLKLYDGRYGMLMLIVNEEGKLHKLPRNDKATFIVNSYGFNDIIVGDAIMCGDKYLEM